MNHSLESADVLSRLAGLAAPGWPAALAQGVRNPWLPHRRPGAKLLVVADGEGMRSRIWE